MMRLMGHQGFLNFMTQMKENRITNWLISVQGSNSVTCPALKNTITEKLCSANEITDLLDFKFNVKTEMETL